MLSIAEYWLIDLMLSTLLSSIESFNIYSRKPFIRGKINYHNDIDFESYIRGYEPGKKERLHFGNSHRIGGNRWPADVRSYRTLIINIQNR